MRLDRLQVRRYMERPAGAAIAAGVRWLTFSCPAYGQFGSVDLRK
jgi:hypothetical protein